MYMHRFLKISLILALIFNPVGAEAAFSLSRQDSASVMAGISAGTVSGYFVYKYLERKEKSFKAQGGGGGSSFLPENRDPEDIKEETLTPSKPQEETFLNKFMTDAKKWALIGGVSLCSGVATAFLAKSCLHVLFPTPQVTGPVPPFPTPPTGKEKGKEKEPPLRFATEENLKKFFEKYKEETNCNLKKGQKPIDPRIFDRDEKAAYEKELRILVAENEGLNMKDENGWTLLNHAINQGDTDLVASLLEVKTISLNHKAWVLPPNYTYGRKMNPFIMALIREQEDIAKLLITKGGDTLKLENQNAFYWCSCFGSENSLKFLIAKANIEISLYALEKLVSSEMRDILDSLAGRPELNIMVGGHHFSIILRNSYRSLPKSLKEFIGYPFINDLIMSQAYTAAEKYTGPLNLGEGIAIFPIDNIKYLDLLLDLFRKGANITTDFLCMLSLEESEWGKLIRAVGLKTLKEDAAAGDQKKIKELEEFEKADLEELTSLIESKNPISQVIKKLQEKEVKKERQDLLKGVIKEIMCQPRSLKVIAAAAVTPACDINLLIADLLPTLISVTTHPEVYAAANSRLKGTHPLDELIDLKAYDAARAYSPLNVGESVPAFTVESAEDFLLLKDLLEKGYKLDKKDMLSMVKGRAYDYWMEIEDKKLENTPLKKALEEAKKTTQEKSSASLIKTRSLIKNIIVNS
jgi:hypothetical protein